MPFLQLAGDRGRAFVEMTQVGGWGSGFAVAEAAVAVPVVAASAEVAAAAEAAAAVVAAGREERQGCQYRREVVGQGRPRAVAAGIAAIAAIETVVAEIEGGEGVETVREKEIGEETAGETEEAIVLSGPPVPPAT